MENEFFFMVIIENTISGLKKNDFLIINTSSADSAKSYFSRLFPEGKVLEVYPLSMQGMKTLYNGLNSAIACATAYESVTGKKYQIN